MRRDDLLVCEGNHEVAAIVVAEAEGVVLERFPASGLLPQRRRIYDRHAHLLPADPIDLLANDLLELLRDAEAERFEGPDAGGDLSDESAAQQQLVADELRLAGRGAKRAAEEMRLSHVRDLRRRSVCDRARGTPAPRLAPASAGRGTATLGAKTCRDCNPAHGECDRCVLSSAAP